MSDTELYVWANPLKVAGFLDHTWVSTYNPINTCPPGTSYWYCWGVCHMTGQHNPQARLLHSRAGNMTLATCISKPDDKSDHAWITGWYGQHGVCHQVANRILFATANETEDPLLVDGAHGFWLSYMLYGDYGGKDDNWEQVQQQCGVITIRPNDMGLQALAIMLEARLGPAYSPAMIGQLREIQQEMLARKAEFEQRVEQREMSIEEFAIAINNMLADYVPRLAEIVGKEYSRPVFGVEPGEDVYLLDVEIAAQSE